MKKILTKYKLVGSIFFKKIQKKNVDAYGIQSDADTVKFIKQSQEKHWFDWKIFNMKKERKY